MINYNKLSVLYGSGYNVIANIVSCQNGYFWDYQSSGLLPFVDANVSRFGIPMSGTGSRGFYIGQVPPTLPVGQYEILYFRRIASSGTLNDTPISKEDLDWRGSSLYDIPNQAGSGYSNYQALQMMIRYNESNISASGTSLVYNDDLGALYSFTLDDPTNPHSRTKV
jgi:hypothetical protein